MHKIGIINSKTLLVSIFIEIQPSTCLPELRSPTEGGDSPLARTVRALLGMSPPSGLGVLPGFPEDVRVHNGLATWQRSFVGVAHRHHTSCGLRATMWHLWRAPEHQGQLTDTSAPLHAKYRTPTPRAHAHPLMSTPPSGLSQGPRRHKLRLQCPSLCPKSPTALQSCGLPWERGRSCPRRIPPDAPKGHMAAP